jgi:hypothetical protein
MIKLTYLKDLSPTEVDKLHVLGIKTLQDLWSFIGENTYFGVANLATQLNIDNPHELARRLEKIALKEIELGPAIVVENKRILLFLWKVYYFLGFLLRWTFVILICAFMVLRFLRISW